MAEVPLVLKERAPASLRGWFARENDIMPIASEHCLETDGAGLVAVSGEPIQ